MRVRKSVKSDRWLRNVCLSVLLYIRMKQLGSHLPDFPAICCLSIFGKYIENIQVSLTS
jgi:hypothetical protein